MAAYVFSTDNYPAVRAAISVDVDDVVLPDATLDLSIYKGETERWITRSLTEAQQAADASATDYAATMYCASLVAPHLRLVASERIAGGNLTYVGLDLEKLAGDLLEKANGALAALQGTEAPTVVAPVFFGKASRRLPY